jgi:hypothetical protein
MEEHECEYYRTGVIAPFADADYVCAMCDCGAVLYFEASESDYAERAGFATCAA